MQVHQDCARKQDEKRHGPVPGGYAVHNEAIDAAIVIVQDARSSGETDLRGIIAALRALKK